jgi:hypothetical protein
LRRTILGWGFFCGKRKDGFARSMDYESKTARAERLC